MRMLTVTLASLAMLVTSSAWADLDEVLEVMDDVIESLDLRTSERIVIGQLPDDDDVTWTFRGLPDGDYSIVAFCDYDCDDIDLCVSRKADSEDWDQCDTESDAFPIAFLNTDGYIQAELSMLRSLSELCNVKESIRAVPGERHMMAVGLRRGQFG